MYIDLRAQLVPIVAAFVALGIGILIGSMLSTDGNLLVEQQLLIENLERQFTGLRNANQDYKTRVAALEERLSEHDEFLEREVLPEFVGPTVAGLRVAVLDIGMDALAGRVTGLLDDWGAEALLVTSPNPTTLIGLEEPSAPPPSDQPALQGADDLVQALRGLLTGGSDVRGDLTQAGFHLAGAVTGRPDAILILVDPDFNQLFGTLLTPLVAGLRADKINVVAAERADQKTSLMTMWRTLNVSTVDNADSGVGLLSLVLALEGRQGHYGTGAAADRLIPAVTGQGGTIQHAK